MPSSNHFAHSNINATKRYAVFGNPIAHSFSPQIYTQLFANNNVRAVYTRIAVQKSTDIFHFINEFNLSGANVTSPCKKDIVPFCEHITEDAKIIGAVNTIIRDNKQQLLGFNTDWEGVLSSLNEYLTRNPKLKFDINNAKMLIVGAGAAASAISFGLTKFYPNASINVVNRTLDNAMLLSKRFNVKCLDVQVIDSDFIAQYDIVFFATTTFDNGDFLLNSMLKTTLLFFATYSNYELFEKIQAHKLKFITGVNWLKHQAISAFEYFYSNDDFCSKFELDDTTIAEELHKFRQRNIYFVGFSGAGKSFIGQKIAKKIGRNAFVDIDCEIEKTTGKSIPELLNEQNEEEFRQIETKLIQRYSKLQNYVIALGAGAICNQANKKLITQTNGFVIYLYSDLQTSLSRIDIATRPLLANKTSKEIEDLFCLRKYIYFDNADLIVVSNADTITTLSENLALFAE